MMSISGLIASLPKAELHIHLEGSFEPEQLFEFSKRNKVSIGYESVERLREAYVFENLQEFLDIYYLGMRVLLSERDFYELAMAYYRRAAADNIRHVEAFFDPQAHTERGVPLEAVIHGFSAAANDAAELGISVLLIPCFLRHLPAEDALSTLNSLEPYLDKITGVGLDSSERDFPPKLFEEVYARAQELGLKLVAHAGEEGPPEYVRQALDVLNVDRIDHGNRAMEDDDLINRLRKEKMALTVCPLSNLKLGGVSDLKEHPLKQMLQQELVATVNSDDPAYFGGYLNENFEQIAAALELDAKDIVTLVRNSFSASFLPASEVARWHAEVDNLATHSIGPQ